MFIKTILRIMREFYKKKLEQITGKRNKRKPRPDLLTSLERMAELLFSPIRTSEGMTSESFANFLAALINPKILQKMDID